MILITGGAGFIGSHIVRRLIEAGKSTRVLVRDHERAKREGRLSNLPVDWAIGDVTQPETLSIALDEVSAVIHTAAIAIEKGSSTYEKINYHGTLNVINATKKASILRFVHLSQLGADASLPYRFLASKGRAEESVAQSGLQWTTFQPSVVWGPEDEFANTFARLALITPLIFPIIGDEKYKFQPVWVEDVATAVVKTLDQPETVGKVYQLGGPDILSLKEIEHRALAAVGVHRLLIPFPMPLLRIIVRLMEKALPSPPVTRNLLELLAVRNVTTRNAVLEFVSNPRPFKVEHLSSYMKDFQMRDTLAKLTGKG